MKKEETPVIEMKKTVKPISTQEKRSEVVKEHSLLQKKNEELLKEMQEREYVVNFKDKGVYNRFCKFLEKDCEWGHTTAAGLIMLYNNVRQEKEKTKDAEWSGDIVLRSVNVSTLWQMLTTMKGKGFYEAKQFVELMAVIGQPISEAVRQVHIDNQELRDNHEQLTKLDHLLDHGNLVNDLKDTTPKPTTQKAVKSDAKKGEKTTK